MLDCLTGNHGRQLAISNWQLQAAYRSARLITKTYAKSFYLSTLLLPPTQRWAIQALYAFLRTADNIVDLPGAGQPEEALEQWRIRSRRSPSEQDDPILLAWADTRARFGIPQGLAETLIDGIAMDLTIQRYPTFAALERYCYCVASTVGLMSMQIIGSACADPQQLEQAAPYAIKLGLAMQLTNILRDIGEDARAGRIYLPQAELAEAGYSEEELLAKVINPAWRRLLDRQIARANALYDESLPGIMLLRSESQFSVATAATTYRGILGKIINNNYDVFNHRARLSTREKLWLLPGIWHKLQRQRTYLARSTNAW